MDDFGKVKDASDFVKEKNKLIQERREVVLAIDDLEAWFRQQKKRSGGWKFNPEGSEKVKEKDELVRKIKEINLKIKVADDNIMRLREEQTLEDRGADAVTDHAVVRWLERRHGIDVHKVREVIVKEAIKGEISNKINKKGCLYVESGNMVYVVNDKMTTILTCFNKEEDFF